MRGVMEKVRKKWMDFTVNEERKALVGQVAFCGYYAVMVLLKTFGYVSYERFYKVSFLLALACLGLKVLLTRYTMREFLILYVLLAVSAVCWLKVGEKNIMFITLTIWGMKNCSFRSLLKSTVLIRVLGTLFMILLSCSGLMDIQSSIDMGTDFSEYKVYAFGYVKSNAAFYTVFVALVVILYLNYRKLNLWYFLGSMALCFAAFQATFCRTGVIVFCGLWALIILDKLTRSKKYYRLISYSTAGLFLLSLLAMVTYRISNPTMFKINRMFNGRIEISNNYYKNVGISLFPKDAQIFWDNNYTTMDNLYVYLFISCGLIVSCLYIYFATRSQLALWRSGHTVEIIFFTTFAVYALLEQSPFNPVLNPFILLLGNLVYRDFRIGDGERKAVRTS